MQLLDLIYVCGFAGTLMIFAWLHYHFLPLGGMFSQKALPWLVFIAVLWPCAWTLLGVVLMLGSAIATHEGKQKARAEAERRRVVHAGTGKSPIFPPYDGSQKRRRYWKKVKEVDGAVSLKRKSRGPRSRT